MVCFMGISSLVLALISGTMSLVTVYLIYGVSSIGFSDLRSAEPSFCIRITQFPTLFKKPLDYLR